MFICLFVFQKGYKLKTEKNKTKKQKKKTKKKKQMIHLTKQYLIKTLNQI